MITSTRSGRCLCRTNSHVCDSKECKQLFSTMCLTSFICEIFESIVYDNITKRLGKNKISLLSCIVSRSDFFALSHSLNSSMTWRFAVPSGGKVDCIFSEFGESLVCCTNSKN